MIIAKAGDFSLRTKTFINEHIYNTHDIEICKDTEDGTCYTVATFNKDGEVVSCNTRLLDAVISGPDAGYDIQYLAKIGSLIMAGDGIESGLEQ